MAVAVEPIKGWAVAHKVWFRLGAVRTTVAGQPEVVSIAGSVASPIYKVGTRRSDGRPHPKEARRSIIAVGRCAKIPQAVSPHAHGRPAMYGPSSWIDVRRPPSNQRVKVAKCPCGTMRPRAPRARIHVTVEGHTDIGFTPASVEC